MFDNFTSHSIIVNEAEIFLRCAGDGPPLVLLHGYPQSHLCWRHVAPALAQEFSVIVPDLRSYGESRGPEPDVAHLGYSKRAMAGDIVAVMAELGFAEFALAGHDRGGRVAYRLALDHPERLTKVSFLDMIPTLEMAERTDKGLALATYHWFFLAQPAPLPERLIGAEPDFYIDWTIRSWLARDFEMEPEVMQAYCRNFHQPSVIQAACEDYRAGMSADLEHDAADRQAGRRITCPVQTLWGENRAKGRANDPVEIWRRWANDVRGRPLDCGHFLPEEKPDEVISELREFFT